MPEQTHSSVINTIKNWWKKAGTKRQMQIKAGTADMDELNKGDMTEKQITHLMEVVQYNYRKLEKLRVKTKDLRKQYYTHLLYEEGAPQEQPVVINKLQDAIRIYLQNMATSTPQAFFDTDYPHLRDWAWSFENATNKHFEEVKLGEAFSSATFDAIVSVGILKTGLGVGGVGVYDENNELIDAGRAFTDVVQLDDFVIDMSAKDPTRIEFIGDRFLRPRKWVKEMTEQYRQGEPFSAVDNPRESEERPEDLISGHDQDPDHKLYDQVYVWDIYLPRENLIVQIPDGAKEPIAVFEWEGPEGGPYDILSFLPASGAPLGPSLGQALYELHMFVNETMRKFGRQNNRMKSIVAYEQGAEDAMTSIRDSSDGEMVGVAQGTLERMKEIKLGGSDPMLGQALAFALQQFDQEGGNLQSLGGLGPSAETFRGDKMIQDTASSLIKFMQVGLQKTAKSVMKKHAWWIWTEDIRSYEGWVNVPGADVSVPWSFTAEEREGDFMDYNFDIKPFSMVETTPSEKVQKVLELYNNFVMPSAELLMQQGFAPNTIETARYVCRYYGVPFDILFKAMDPEMQEQMMQSMSKGALSQPPRLNGPQNQTRTYERVSRPGTTPNGNLNEFMRQMSAAGGQEAGAAPDMAQTA